MPNTPPPWSPSANLPSQLRNLTMGPLAPRGAVRAWATPTTLQFSRRPLPSLSTRRIAPRVARVTCALRRAQIPMALTWARVAAVPVLVGAYLGPAYALQGAVCAGIFAVASATDWLDGFLARRWGVVSALGAFLDPVADKLMVAAALVLIVGRLVAPVVCISAVVILCREIFVSALREWMAGLGKRDDVKVGFVGKIKTAVQMTSLTMLLAVSDLSSALATGGVVLLAASAVLALYSGLGYVRAALPSLQSDVP